jgi:N-acetylglucosaminyl-diphospho-decaprenol L-rhamnosyltransferase
VIVVNYNTAHLLTRMFAALRSGQGNFGLQVIVIDNASHDGSVAFLKANFPNVELIENAKNVGFGRANNQALPLIRGRYILLLNTDAFISSDTLTKTISFMDENPRCGVLGVKLAGEDNVLQPSCRYFPTPWNVFLTTTGLYKFFPASRLVDDMSWDHASVRKCDWVPGCFYLIRREVVDTIGLFDPRYFLYSEEVDHCRRVRAAGWDVIYYPFTEVVHIGGESAKAANQLMNDSGVISALHIESELLYFRKHHGLSGLAASVLLSTLADAVIALKRFVQRDTKRAKTALEHAMLVIRLLVDTRLASRPTR